MVIDANKALIVGAVAGSAFAFVVSFFIYMGRRLANLRKQEKEAEAKAAANKPRNFSPPPPGKRGDGRGRQGNSPRHKHNPAQDIDLRSIDFSTMRVEQIKQMMSDVSDYANRILVNEIATTLTPQDVGKFIAINVRTRESDIGLKDYLAAEQLRKKDREGEIVVIEITKDMVREDVAPRPHTGARRTAPS